MQEIIAKFDAVMAEYNEAYTSVESEKEQQAVNEKFEKIISEAEQVMEKSLEEFLEKEQEALLKEQKESELIIEEEEEEPEDGKEPSIEEITEYLKGFTVKEHKAVIKAAGISGYSRLKEDELIDVRIKNGLY